MVRDKVACSKSFFLQFFLNEIFFHNFFLNEIFFTIFFRTKFLFWADLNDRENEFEHESAPGTGVLTAAAVPRETTTALGGGGRGCTADSSHDNGDRRLWIWRGRPLVGRHWTMWGKLPAKSISKRMFYDLFQINFRNQYCIIPLFRVPFCIHSGITPAGQFSRKCAKSINQSSIDFHRLIAWLTVS